jgi:exosortase
LILVWIPGLLELVEVWSRVEYASHGFLVPVVSLWAATAHREALAQLEPRPLPGGRLMLAALAPVYLAALIFDNPTLIGVLAIVTVVTTVLALRGFEWVKILRFSLAYLVFMVPLPVSWVTPIIVKLQLWVSQAAVELLQLQGVAIYREGNVLALPGNVELFVAEACSGITSLITLIPIGVFIAYFTDSVLWRRLALVVCVIPIALAGNLLRVILTVWLSIEVSVDFATTGPLHEWAGVLTYVVGCLALLCVGALLRRFGPGLDAAAGP